MHIIGMPAGSIALVTAITVADRTPAALPDTHRVAQKIAPAVIAKKRGRFEKLAFCNSVGINSETQSLVCGDTG